MKYELPKLPYAYDALEPYIDAKTMDIHYTKHHQTYVNKLNEALDKHPEIADKGLNELLANLDAVPEDIRTAVRNHGGGHRNHSFWRRHLVRHLVLAIGFLKQHPLSGQSVIGAAMSYDRADFDYSTEAEPLLKGHAGAVEHPVEVVVGREQQAGGVGEGRVRREPLRVGVAVRADDRQAGHFFVEPARHAPHRRVRREQPIFVEA